MHNPFSRKGSEKMLRVLLEYPERRFSINELSKAAKVPFGTAWNVVNEWEASGIVRTEKIGRAVAVSLGSGPYLETARKLLELSVSAQRAALKAIARRLRKAGVKEAYLFGSVAEGREKPGSDIDIALVAPKGFGPGEEALELHELLSVKAVFLTFRSKKELGRFLEGKKTEKLV